MLFKRLRYINNLLNTKKYKKNIGNVEIASKTESLTNIATSDLSELDKAFVKEKQNNLSLYRRTSALQYIMSIPIYCIPIILIYANIHVINNTTKTELDKYKVTTTTEEQGYLVDQDEEVYFYNPEEYKIKDENVNVLESTNTIIDYTLESKEVTVTAKLDIDENGITNLISNDEDNGITEIFKLSSNSPELKKDGEINDKYNHIYEHINKFLTCSDSVTQSQQELIEELLEDENTRILFKIIEKEYLGKDEIDVKKSSDDNRKELLLITFLYIFSVLIIIPIGVIERPYNWPSLRYFENRYRYDNRRNLTIWHYNSFITSKLATQKALMEAENNRIKRCIETARQHGLTDEDIIKILTRFEKIVAEKQQYLEPAKGRTR